MQESHPIAFDSRMFNKVKFNYSIRAQEMLAFVRVVQTWRYHLEGSQFTPINRSLSRHFLMDKTIFKQATGSVV